MTFTELSIPPKKLKEKSARLEELTKILEAATDEQPSRITEIVDSFFIEVKNPEKIKEILDGNGITYKISPGLSPRAATLSKVTTRTVRKSRDLSPPLPRI